LKKKQAGAAQKQAEAAQKAKQDKAVQDALDKQTTKHQEELGKHLAKTGKGMLKALLKELRTSAKDVHKTQAKIVGMNGTTGAQLAKNLQEMNFKAAAAKLGEVEVARKLVSTLPAATEPEDVEVALPASDKPGDDEVALPATDEPEDVENALPASGEPEDDEAQDDEVEVESAPVLWEENDGRNRNNGNWSRGNRIRVQLPLTQSHRDILVNLDECHSVTAIVTKSCQHVLEVFHEGVKEARGLGGVLYQIKGRLPRELMDDLWFIANERNWLVHDRWVYALSDKKLSEYQRRAEKVLGALCPNWKLVHYNVGLERYKAQQAWEQAQARNNKRGRDGDEGYGYYGNGYGPPKRRRNDGW
jgi:hypothetical protein